MCTKNPLYIKHFKFSNGYFFGGKGVQNWHHKGYKIGTIKGTQSFTSTLKSDIIEIEIREVYFMKLQDLLLVAVGNYHVFFKTDMADISGLPYTEIKKEELRDYLNMTVLHVDQEWNIIIGWR